MSECDRVRSRLAEHAVGAVRGRARARLEAHVRACAACREELAALERTGALVGAVGLEEPPAGTWEMVRQRIAERPQGRGRGWLGRRPRWAWVMVTGVALVLVALGVTRLVPPRGRPPVVVTAEADEEMQATIEGHLSTAWAAPLSDTAAAGLQMAAPEEDG